MKKEELNIGVISDIHGLLRQEAEQYLEECDLIIRTGNTENAEIIYQLREKALVHAIRGNMDMEKWAGELPDQILKL